MVFVTFQVESERMVVEVPSVNEICIAASSPAGPSPPFPTAARLLPRTAKTFESGLSETTKTWADFHISIAVGEEPTALPFTNSEKRSSTVRRMVADVATLPLGLVNVFRNALSCAGAFGAPASDDHIHDATFKDAAKASGTAWPNAGLPIHRLDPQSLADKSPVTNSEEAEDEPAEVTTLTVQK